MPRRRNTARRSSNRRRTARNNKGITGRKWVTAVEAGQFEFARTGSLERARAALQRQALYNARKLFGSIGEGK